MLPSEGESVRCAVILAQLSEVRISVHDVARSMYECALLCSPSTLALARKSRTGFSLNVIFYDKGEGFFAGHLFIIDPKKERLFSFHFGQVIFHVTSTSLLTFMNQSSQGIFYIEHLH